MPNAKNSPNAPPKPRKRGVRRRRKAGDLKALQRELWHAVSRLGELLDAPEAEAGDIVRVANALGTVANAYRGVTETADIVPRLEALEAELNRS